ncbi:MAG: hypothetical protein PUP93_23430 [Rhizonema sp. NSF051]|nr:hypothetical protein [Rhizonema sp. NSF051]
MNNQILTDFDDNNFSDRNPHSIVVAIANKSLDSLNEQIAEAGLDQVTALTATTSAITAFWLDMGRKFSDMKLALKPKEKFRDLVSAMGRTVTFVNKLIRATKIADDFPVTTAYTLGIDILAQLAQPKYADLIDDFINHPPENQLEASDRIKEFARSQPKKIKTPWLQRGSHLTVDGLSREYQAPIVSETVGLIIEQESEKVSLPPRLFVEQAVQAFVEPKAKSAGQKILSGELCVMSEDLEVVAAVAEHHKIEAEELKASLNSLELERTSAETMLAEVVETASALPIDLIKALLPLSKRVPVVLPEVTEPIGLLLSRGAKSAGESTLSGELCAEEQRRKELMDVNSSSPLPPCPSAQELPQQRDALTEPIRELIPIGAARKPKNEKSLAIGDIVLHCGVIYRVESEPDADGDVECRMVNGRTRHIAVQFLKKCVVG